MKTIYCILFLYFEVNTVAQIIIDTDQSADFYVKEVLLGSGIQVSNIKHIGMIGGLGQFKADQEIIGVESGVILSTGNADSVIGPNNHRGYTSMGLIPESKIIQRQMKRGDKDLNKLCSGKTIDITVIEFDFIPINNVISFNYVFGSEEYKEYVNSRYNDVFGFFLNGPRIKKKINLATLPDGKTPITIGNVNHKRNKKYYRSNSKKVGIIKTIFSKKSVKQKRKKLREQLQLDGLTTVLNVRCDVIPFQKYHLKIAIGDVADGAFDSAVFIEAQSFVSVVDTTGKYYPTLKNTQSQNLNIDSIFNDESLNDNVNSEIKEDFEITDIYFSSNSFELSDTALICLDELVTYLNNNKELNLFIYGYTDNIGSKKANQLLSDNRAKAVSDYLISKGIEANRITISGFNYENSVNNNSTEQERALNRRVVIVLEN